KNINAKGLGRKDGNTTSGVLISDARNAVIDHVRAEGFQKSGIRILRSSTVKVRNAEAINNGSIGIDIDSSKNCIVIDSKANDNPGDPTNLTNHSGNGILVGNS